MMGSILLHSIVFFILLVTLRFFSLLTNDTDTKGEKTRNKTKKQQKIRRLFFSSLTETLWAFGIAIESGILMT